jgi:diguanylate cyclase (GGDEF)-like protein
MRNSKKLYYFFLAFFLFFLILVVFIIINTNILINNPDILKIENFVSNNKNDDLKYRKINNSKPQLYQFSAEIKNTDIKKIRGENYKILSYRLIGQWYKIYFNNNLIGSAGNLINENTNIGNSIYVFDIDEKLINENNTLTVEILADNELGFLSFPLLFTDSLQASKLQNWFNNILNNIYTITLGFLIIASFILFLLCFFTNITRLEHLFYALSTFTTCFYILDYITINYIPVPLLFFKKLVYSSLFLSNAFISFAISTQFKSKLVFSSGLVLISSAVFLIVFPDNFHDLKFCSSLLNLLIITNTFSWFYITSINYKKSLTARTLFFSGFIILILAGYEIFQNFHLIPDSNNFINYSIFCFLFFSIIIICLVIKDFIILHESNLLETEKSKLYYEKSTKDLMTDCYNHEYIINLVKTLNNPYSIIMFDIDNFKKINDVFGHQTGNTVIKFITNEIKNNVRETDFVARYGGDEFIALLLNADSDIAYQISENILNTVKSHKFNMLENNHNVTLSIGIYQTEGKERSEDVFSKVDKAMYISKNNGKNQISIY